MLKHWLAENENKIIKLRHWLHQHPEVGFDEIETGKYLQKLLISAGYEITQTPAMKTGFICEYGDANSTPVLAIRCDMDGLLVQEISDAEYKSINNGVLDTSFQVDWDQYRNCLLATNEDGLRRISTEVKEIVYIKVKKS